MPFEPKDSSMTALKDELKVARSGSSPWADSALRPRLWRLDAKAVFPLLVWLLHWSWWTLGVALVGILVLAVMDFTGLPPETCLARFRCLLVGPVRPIVRPGVLRERARW